jgi:O-antigen/teichoic acid export membrane protein
MRSKLLGYIESKPFITNSLWAIGGSATGKILNFFCISTIANQLGSNTFGEFNVVQTTIGLFGTVSGLGLGLAATKLIAEWRTKDKNHLCQIIGSLYSISILMSVVVASIFYFSATYIGSNVLNNNSLVIMFKITAGIVVFDSINGVQNGILSGFEGFREISLINLISGIIASILLLSMTRYFSIIGLTSGLLLSKAITVAITTHYLRKILSKEKITMNLGINRKSVKTIFQISIPSFLSTMATTPVTWLTTSIFANQRNGYSALGTYNAVNQLRQLVLFLPDSAGKISIPKLANAYGTQNYDLFRKILISTVISNAIFSVIPSLAVYLVRAIFKGIIGIQYFPNDTLMIVILTTGILIAITNAIGYIFICSNMVWLDFKLRLVWAISWLIIVIVYGKHNESIGYGISILCSYAVLLTGQTITLLYKLMKLQNTQSR